MANFKHKPHLVEGARYPLAPDAQATPPVPCDFKLGDQVVFTNDYGVPFTDKLVTGFTPSVEDGGRFIYLDNSAWWFAHTAHSLKHQVL